MLILLHFRSPLLPARKISILTTPLIAFNMICTYILGKIVLVWDLKPN